MEADCLKRLRIKHKLEKDPNAQENVQEAQRQQPKKAVYVDSEDEFGDILG